MSIHVPKNPAANRHWCPNLPPLSSLLSGVHRLPSRDASCHASGFPRPTCSGPPDSWATASHNTLGTWLWLYDYYMIYTDLYLGVHDGSWFIILFHASVVFMTNKIWGPGWFPEQIATRPQQCARLERCAWRCTNWFLGWFVNVDN